MKEGIKTSKLTNKAKSFPDTFSIQLFTFPTLVYLHSFIGAMQCNLTLAYTHTQARTHKYMHTHTFVHPHDAHTDLIWGLVFLSIDFIFGPLSSSAASSAASSPPLPPPPSSPPSSSSSFYLFFFSLPFLHALLSSFRVKLMTTVIVHSPPPSFPP